MTDETPLIFRSQFINRLAQVFSAEYKAMLAHYTPTEQLALTDHLLYILEQVIAYATAMLNENDREAVQYYQNYMEREEQLLYKFGSRFVPYLQYRFQDYFSTDIILCLRKIIPDEAFKTLEEQQRRLSEDEVNSFVRLCRYELRNQQKKLLLTDAHKDTTTTPQEVAAAPEGTRQTGLLLTRGRQLLMVYYLLRSLGMELRSTTSISDVARLVHAITGIRFTNLQNSEVYKKLSELSVHKTHKKDDLFLIRNYFDKAGLQQVVALIDEELEQNYRKVQ